MGLMFESLTLMQLVLAFFAAIAAGAINAIAGGGTLISFPALTFIGIPPVAANVTNTVALTPGYLGATYAQMKDLRGQGSRLRWLMPAAVLGGLVGGWILLNTDERVFQALVPWLILLASGLLAFQGQIRAWWLARTQQGAGGDNRAAMVGPIFAASIYGGYFGAGLSVIVLAVLGLTIDDTLTRLNALKQAIAFAVNTTAAVFFIFSGHVVWAVAMVMAVGALTGGVIGGKLAGRISPIALRRLVVTIGVIVALIYLVR